MDYLEERKLNLRDLNLKHIKGEIYAFQGVQIDMSYCGLTQLQMYRHIASILAERLKDISLKEEIEKAWLDGNKKGWDMSTDWPGSATEYYEKRFLFKEDD